MLKGMLRILGSLRIKAASSPPKIGRALLTEACTKMRSACDSNFFQSARVSLISFSSAAYASEQMVSMLACSFCAVSIRMLGRNSCANQGDVVIPAAAQQAMAILLQLMPRGHSKAESRAGARHGNSACRRCLAKFLIQACCCGQAKILRVRHMGKHTEGMISVVPHFFYV